MSNLSFSDHAIDRFIQRHAPEATREEVRAYLTEHAPTAVRLKEKTFGGQFLWKIGEYRAVTKRDNRQDIVVTILPAVARRAYSEDELERIRDYQQRLNEQASQLKAEKEAIHNAANHAKNVYLREKANEDVARVSYNATKEARELWERAKGAAQQTEKTVRGALQAIEWERCILRDWEKTVRHGMRVAREEEQFRKMLAYLRTLDTAEARALVEEIESATKAEKQEVPVQSRTAPGSSR